MHEPIAVSAASRRAAFLAVSGLLLFNLLTLGRVPEIPNADDGGYAAAAYQFWSTGHPGVPGYRDVLGLDRDIFAFGRIAAAVQGIFMWRFGVSLVNARLPSFLAGLLLLGLTFGLARRLWDERTAILSVVILAASGMFFSACHWTRPDLLLTVCFIGSLWLFAAARPGQVSLNALLAGLVMGFSGDVHMNGFLLAPIPLLFWLLLRPEAMRVRILTALAFAGGGFVGVIFWVGLHYWPDPEALRLQAAVFGGKTHGIRIVNLGVIGALCRETQRYLAWFWEARLHRNVLEGLAVLGCGIWMLWLGGRTERAIVLAWVSIFVVATCLMSNPYGWYLIYVWPLFAVWMARGFRAAAAAERPWQRRGAGIVFATVVVGYLGNLALWTGQSLHGPSYSTIARELRSIVPAQAAVVAGGEWWFALWDRNFTDAQHLLFRRLEAEVNPAAAPTGWSHEWSRLHWQFVVAHADEQRMLDPEEPIEDVESSLPADVVRDARAFSLAHGRVSRRIQTASTPVLVLGIEGEANHVAR
ncbi:MAG: glycosyltransferase family 39 protein [Planctomycetes bacterium]|nr:glycosyltransferase family 39 protein [Planctomycetota bacterium]